MPEDGHVSVDPQTGVITTSFSTDVQIQVVVTVMASITL